MPLSSPIRNYLSPLLETASRTLTVDDAFQMLYNDNAANVFTVPPDTFDQGVQISLCDFGGGVPLFAEGAGVTIESVGALGPTAQFTVASIIRVPADVAGDSNTWICVGNVL